MRFFFFFSFKVGQCLVAAGYSRLCARQVEEAHLRDAGLGLGNRRQTLCN